MTTASGSRKYLVSRPSPGTSLAADDRARASDFVKSPPPATLTKALPVAVLLRRRRIANGERGSRRLTAHACSPAAKIRRRARTALLDYSPHDIRSPSPAEPAPRRKSRPDLLEFNTSFFRQMIALDVATEPGPWRRGFYRAHPRMRVHCRPTRNTASGSQDKPGAEREHRIGLSTRFLKRLVRSQCRGKPAPKLRRTGQPLDGIAQTGCRCVPFTRFCQNIRQRKPALRHVRRVGDAPARQFGGDANLLWSEVVHPFHQRALPYDARGRWKLAFGAAGANKWRAEGIVAGAKRLVVAASVGRT